MIPTKLETKNPAQPKLKTTNAITIEAYVPNTNFFLKKETIKNATAQSIGRIDKATPKLMEATETESGM